MASLPFPDIPSDLRPDIDDIFDNINWPSWKEYIPNPFPNYRKNFEEAIKYRKEFGQATERDTFDRVEQLRNEYIDVAKDEAAQVEYRVQQCAEHMKMTRDQLKFLRDQDLLSEEDYQTAIGEISGAEEKLPGIVREIQEKEADWAVIAGNEFDQIGSFISFSNDSEAIKDRFMAEMWKKFDAEQTKHILSWQDAIRDNLQGQITEYKRKVEQLEITMEELHEKPPSPAVTSEIERTKQSLESAQTMLDRFEENLHIIQTEIGNSKAAMDNLGKLFDLERDMMTLESTIQKNTRMYNMLDRNLDRYHQLEQARDVAEKYYNDVLGEASQHTGEDLQKWVTNRLVPAKEAFHQAEDEFTNYFQRDLGGEKGLDEFLASRDEYEQKIVQQKRRLRELQQMHSEQEGDMMHGATFDTEAIKRRMDEIDQEKHPSPEDLAERERLEFDYQLESMVNEQREQAMSETTELLEKAKQELKAALEKATDESKSFLQEKFQSYKNWLKGQLLEVVNPIKRTAKIILMGYEQWAIKKITKGGLGEFVEEASRGARTMSKEEVSAALKEIAEMAELPSEAYVTSELIFARYAQYSSVTYRARLLYTKEIQNLIQGETKLAKFLDFITLGWVQRITINAFRLGITAPAVAMEYAGFARVANAVFEGGLEALELVGKVISVYNTLYGNIFIFGIIVAIDAFNAKSREHFRQLLANFFTFGVYDATKFMTETMKLYPTTSTIADKPTSSKGDDIIMRDDYKMKQAFFDYFGPLMVKYARKEGDDKIADYRKYAEYKSQGKHPGKYIDLKNHPFESDDQVALCQQYEDMIDHGYLDEVNHENVIYSASAFPRKKGMVRNLVEFPAYQNTFNWPPIEGYVQQTSGWWQDSRTLDPQIWTMFEKWVDTGTYGPAYNQAKSKDLQRVAIKANLEAYQQFLKPKMTDPFVWTDILNWLDHNDAKRYMMRLDMVLFEADSFNEEWNQTVAEGIKTGKYAIGEKGNFTGFSVKTENNPHTIDAVEHVRGQSGRFNYFKEFRDTYEMCAKKGKVRYMAMAPSGSAFVPGIWVMVERKATKAEKERYTKAYNDGIKYHEITLKKKTMTLQNWQKYILPSVFQTYLDGTSQTRNKRGFIVQHFQFFIQEFEFLCNSLLGNAKKRIWDEYQQIKRKEHIPLNMGMYRRMAFAGELLRNGLTDTTLRTNTELVKWTNKLLEDHCFGTTKTKYPYCGVEAYSETTGGYARKDMGEQYVRMLYLENPKTIFLLCHSTGHYSKWNIDIDLSEAIVLDIRRKKDKKTKKDVFDFHENAPMENDKLLGGDLYNPQYALVQKYWWTMKKGFIKVVNEKLKQWVGEHGPPDDVFVVGLGAGAAFGSLLAMEMNNVTARDKARPHCYSFSCPAVGDQRLYDKATAYVGECAQIWIQGDMQLVCPPTIIPDPESSPKSGKNVLEAMATAFQEKDKFGGLIYLIHTVVNWSRTADTFDPYRIANKNGRVDYRKLVRNAKEYTASAVAHQGFRIGGAFFRLSPSSTGAITESARDISIDQSFIQEIAATKIHPELKLKYSDLGFILQQLKLVADKHPDVFQLETQQQAAWDAGGMIHPYYPGGGDDPKPPPPPPPIPPQPQPKGGGDDYPITPELAKLLRDPRSKVVGFGHSRHFHYPYRVVNKRDIDQTKMLMIPEDLEVKLERPIKRKKIARKDEQYY